MSFVLSTKFLISVHEDLEGGSFWSGLKNIVHKIATVASPILGAVAPEFQGIAEGIKNVTGSGMHHKDLAED
jgi:hypothetical protein